MQHEADSHVKQKPYDYKALNFSRCNGIWNYRVYTKPKHQIVNIMFFSLLVVVRNATFNIKLIRQRAILLYIDIEKKKMTKKYEWQTKRWKSIAGLSFKHWIITIVTFWKMITWKLWKINEMISKSVWWWCKIKFLLFYFKALKIECIELNK